MTPTGDLLVMPTTGEGDEEKINKMYSTYTRFISAELIDVYKTVHSLVFSTDPIDDDIRYEILPLIPREPFLKENPANFFIFDDDVSIMPLPPDIE